MKKALFLVAVLFSILIGNFIAYASYGDILNYLTGSNSRNWKNIENYLNGYKIFEDSSQCRIGTLIKFDQNGNYAIQSICSPGSNLGQMLPYTISGSILSIVGASYQILEISDTALWLQQSYSANMTNSISGSTMQNFTFTSKWIPNP